MEKNYKTPNEGDYRRLIISEVVTMIVCGMIIYELMKLHGSMWDMRLLLPGAILLIMLAQGAVWWWYKMLLCGSERFREDAFMRFFRFFNQADPYIIAIYPVYILIVLLTNRAAFFSPLNIFGCLLDVFAAVEYINYYKMSLNYTNWKTRATSGLYDILHEVTK